MINISKKFRRKLLRKFKHKSLVLTAGSSLVFGACNTGSGKKRPKIEISKEIDKDESANISPEARSIRLEIANKTFFRGDDEFEKKILNVIALKTRRDIQNVIKNISLLPCDKSEKIKDIIIRFLIGNKKELKKGIVNNKIDKTGINLREYSGGQEFILGLRLPYMFKKKTYDDIYQLKVSDCSNIRKFLHVILKKAPKNVVEEIQKKVVPEYAKSFKVIKGNKENILGKRWKRVALGLSMFAFGIASSIFLGYVIAPTFLVSTIIVQGLWLSLAIIPLMVFSIVGSTLLGNAKEDIDIDDKYASVDMKKTTIEGVLKSVGNKNKKYTEKDWLDDIRNQLGTKETASKSF